MNIKGVEEELSGALKTNETGKIMHKSAIKSNNIYFCGRDGGAIPYLLQRTGMVGLWADASECEPRFEVTPFPKQQKEWQRLALPVLAPSIGSL